MNHVSLDDKEPKRKKTTFSKRTNFWEKPARRTAITKRTHINP